jgi:antitoxin (DNA-binding transcriptional repressor) of toxin-antitoxin stability system
MRVVGVKQLKARLSEYLREVRRGEVFLVTDRDQVVAELRPPQSRALPPIDDVDAVLGLLQQSGDVAAPRLAKNGWTWTPAGIGLSEGDVTRVLEWVRADRGEDVT